MIVKKALDTPPEETCAAITAAVAATDLSAAFLGKGNLYAAGEAILWATALGPECAARSPWWRRAFEGGVWRVVERHGKKIQSLYFEAIKPVPGAHVSVHLAAAAPFMLATQKRILDKGYWGITELKYTPINSDVVESGFGHLDLCIRSLHGTLIQGCFGVAYAAALKAFATAGGKRKAGRASAQAEARANGTTGAGVVDKAVVQAKLTA